MNRTVRTILGVCSFLIPTLIFVVLFGVCLLPFLVDDMEGEIPEPLRPVVVVALLLSFVSVLGAMALVVIYMIHVACNDGMPGGRKAGWICALWFLNIFAIPVYWLRHVR